MAAVRSGLWGIWRLGLVSLLAVIAFAVALIGFRDVPASECQMDAAEDRSLRVELLTPPIVDAVGHTIRVDREGAPVTGAQVCMRADLRGMSALGVSDQAVEDRPGEYVVPVRFERRGTWDATVIVGTGTGEPSKVGLAIVVR